MQDFNKLIQTLHPLERAVIPVLENDIDIDGDDLTANLITDVTSGTLDLNLNGSFNYSPNENFTGTDSFTYKANDGFVDSNEATVTITISTASTMHVRSIALSVKTKGPWSRAFAKVRILDENGEPVSGAEVRGTFSGLEIGQESEPTSSTTNRKGIAKLKVERKGQIFWKG